MPASVSAVSQEVDVAANALRGIAVMAYAVGAAWRVDVKTLGIDGGCCTTRPGKGGLYCLGHLVDADHEDHLLGSPGDGCHSVAVAVDIHDDAIL